MDFSVIGKNVKVLIYTVWTVEHSVFTRDAVFAATYHVEASPLAWQAPLAILCGLTLQLASYIAKNRLLLCIGFCCAGFGAFLESDVTLLIGDAIAALGLWFIFKKPKN